MRAILRITFLLSLFVTAAANAFVLSFDATATGMAEMAPDGSAVTTCVLPDVCGLSLTFTNIDGSSVSATLEAMGNAPPNVFPLSLWYQVGSDPGGMGAATEAEATFGDPGFDPDAANAIGLEEIVIVTFSELVAVDAFWVNGVGALHNGTAGIFPAEGGPPLEIADCIDSFCDSMTWTGTSFAFSANPGTPYFLAGVSFELAPVPVPAAVWLFASALGLLSVLRRR